MVDDLLPLLDCAFGLPEEIVAFEYFHDLSLVSFQLVTLLADVCQDLRVHFEKDLLLPAVLSVEILLVNQALHLPQQRLNNHLQQRVLHMLLQPPMLNKQVNQVLPQRQHNRKLLIVPLQ